MRDYADDYLKEPGKPMSGTLKMVLKLVALGFISAAVTDLMKSYTQVQTWLADSLGLLCGVLAQQAVPPRLSVGKLLMVLFGVCGALVILIFLHL